jgi:hypothetical protein
VCNAIGKFEFAIAGETIEDQCKTLIALHITRAFKEFVQYCADNIS